MLWGRSNHNQRQKEEIEQFGGGGNSFEEGTLTASYSYRRLEDLQHTLENLIVYSGASSCFANLE